jgi:hypothetical protein
MSSHETIKAILDAKVSSPYGDRCSFKLGYLMEMLGGIADRYPDVANELQTRLKIVKGL